MTDSEIERVLAEELCRIAPEIPVAKIDRTADLRDELETDSMDCLTIVTALAKRLHVDMPERNYGEMRRFKNLVTDLRMRVARDPSWRRSSRRRSRKPILEPKAKQRNAGIGRPRALLTTNIYATEAALRTMLKGLDTETVHISVLVVVISLRL